MAGPEVKGFRRRQAGTPALGLVVGENGSNISTEVGSAPESGVGWDVTGTGHNGHTYSQNSEVSFFKGNTHLTIF